MAAGRLLAVHSTTVRPAPPVPPAACLRREHLDEPLIGCVHRGQPDADHALVGLSRHADNLARETRIVRPKVSCTCAPRSSPRSPGGGDQPLRGGCSDEGCGSTVTTVSGLAEARKSRPASSCQARSVSATDHACAMHPRGANGESPSKNSATEPSPWSQRGFAEGEEEERAAAAARETL